MSMKLDSLNGASIPLFCIYKQHWDVGGVSGLSTNRKHEGITSEAHSMRLAKGDLSLPILLESMCVCVCDRKGVRGVCDVSKAAVLVLCVCVCVGGVRMYMLISAGVTEQYDLCTMQSDLLSLLSTECLDMARSLLRT